MDKEYKKDEDTDRPANLNLWLGFYADEYGLAVEWAVNFSELNVFKSALSVQRMISITTAGDTWNPGMRHRVYCYDEL